MKINLIALLLFGITASAVYGQTEVDLYRFSNTFNEGSARFEAMGGSFGALGADIGSARINPAGFARYSSSQFSFGFSSNITNNKSVFRETVTKSDKFNLRLSNMGVVLTSDISSKRGGFLFQQLGVGFTGVANFTNNVSYTGTQYKSLLDVFSSQAQGVNPDSLSNNFLFSTFPAYQTYAIDYDPATGSYIPEISANSSVVHTRTIATKGGMSELHVAYSANYLNKLYLGANVGFQFLNYQETTTHHEDIVDTSGPATLTAFDYIYNLKTSGNGTNFKLGAIYLPVESVRIGLAFHSPTYFTLTDTYSADMIAYHKDTTIALPSDLAPSGDYKYRMRTPARIIGSFAYIFGTRGCVNIDLEYLDYRWANFKYTTDPTYARYDYSAVNKAADERFRAVLNARIGAELVLFSNFFLRGGYGFLPKGDKQLFSYGGKYDQMVSGGIGYRSNHWTFDISVRSLLQTRIYSEFPQTDAMIATNQKAITLNAQVKF